MYKECELFGGCQPECLKHPVRWHLSAQFTNVHSRIISLCMLSILELNEMHFANVIETPNNMSRSLPIDVRI